MTGCKGNVSLEFARQRWRAWIETGLADLKDAANAAFARQRWRAWIETSAMPCHRQRSQGSPVSDGGRGLKHRPRRAPLQRGRVRPSAMAGVD